MPAHSCPASTCSLTARLYTLIPPLSGRLFPASRTYSRGSLLTQLDLRCVLGCTHSTMRCLYEVLECDRGADDAAIKKSYRKLALQWHPGALPLWPYRRTRTPCTLERTPYGISAHVSVSKASGSASCMLQCRSTTPRCTPGHRSKAEPLYKVLCYIYDVLYVLLCRTVRGQRNARAGHPSSFICHYCTHTWCAKQSPQMQTPSESDIPLGKRGSVCSLC